MAGPDSGLLGVIEGLPAIGDFDATVEEQAPIPDGSVPDAAPEDAAMPEPDAAPPSDIGPVDQRRGAHERTAHRFSQRGRGCPGHRQRQLRRR